MKESKLSSRKLIIILAAAAIILIPGRYGLDNLNVLKSEAEQIRSEADNLNGRSQIAEDEVVANAEAFESRENAANTAIPKESDTSTLIDLLASQAADSNLLWLSGSPSSLGDTSGVGGTYSLSISLQTADGATGEAAVAAVSDFLTKVRSLERLVVVDSVNISPDSGTATVQARFFSQISED